MKKYRGWEIIKLAEEGKFKDGTILKDNANKYQIKGNHICYLNNEKYIDCWNLINNHFELLEDEEIDTQTIEELNPNKIYFKDGTEYIYTIMYDKINEIIEVVNKMQLDNKTNKEYCQSCGVELNIENRALKNMCNECKYGLDR